MSDEEWYYAAAMREYRDARDAGGSVWTFRFSWFRKLCGASAPRL